MSDHHNQPVSQPLRLAAIDVEDLAVFSAHLQDAVLRVSQMAFLPKQHRFALVVERLNRNQSDEADAGLPPRQSTGVHFEGVKRARHHNIQMDAPDQLLHLLAITFTPTEAPAGQVILHCADDRLIRLDVDFLEAQLADLPAGGKEF
jgi:hypothetical protein